MKKSLVVLYRPSGKNFSLGSFCEVLGKVREYFTELKREKPDFKILLAGDFNFPKEIVEWISTDDGLIGDAKEGNTPLKEAYRQLNNLSVDFDLEQIVSKPTRKTAILDLIFT